MYYIILAIKILFFYLTYFRIIGVKTIIIKGHKKLF